MRALTKISLLAAVVVLGGLAFPAAGTHAFPSFSLAPGSPSVGLGTGTVLNPATGAPTPAGPQGAPVVVFTAASLGLPPGVNLDDFSYGDDAVSPFVLGGFPLTFQFSVAPGALGGPWLGVLTQNVLTQGVAGENTVAGDIFTTTIPVVPPPGGALGCGLAANAQLYDGNGVNALPPPLAPSALGGLAETVGPPADDDIDGYDNKDFTAVDYQMSPGAPLSGPDGAPDGPVFFTVPTGAIAGISGADILVTDRASLTGYSVYAFAFMLGLAFGDDIDALLVGDSGAPGPGGIGSMAPPPRMFGAIHPTDFVGYSLKPGSPSLAVLPPVCGFAAATNTVGDMWGISPLIGFAPFPLVSAQGLGLCAAPRVLGCTVTDNLDAIDISWAGDFDADGMIDAIEALPPCGTGPGPDSDADGIPDSIEIVLSTTPAGACTAFPSPALPDSDLDGMPDGWEFACWLPSMPAANPSAPDPGADFDADGVTNIAELAQLTLPCDADTDGDGFSDLPASNTCVPPPAGAICPLGPANTTVTQDNCPSVVNPSQLNSDANFTDLPALYPFDDKTWANSDPMGDACDTDDDNDGILDGTETAGPPCPTATLATSPTNRDSDGDNVVDGAECALGSDPASAASKPAIPPAAMDPDGDRLSSAFEAGIGTNPLVNDTDGDGVGDGVEYKGYNSSPLVANTDGDSCTDVREILSVDGNVAVNGGDLATVAGEFNFAIPGAGTPDFDVDRNGKINGADLSLISSKVPTFCP